jgi:glycosyltransferase involved in cell wall biosynthesis
VNVQALRVQVREELMSARAFDSILVNSHFSRESVLRAYGIAAKVCYLGVDSGLFVTQQQPRDRFVVGLGALIPEKRPEMAIEALSRLRDPRPQLVWIGNVSTKAYAEQVLNFARARSVKVRLELGIADKEVVNFLNRAAMLIYAPRLEPFGFAPLEANACGLAIVAVAEGGVRETVFHGVNGLVVEDDPGAMASAISSLLRDPDYASRLGEAGRRMVEREWSLAAAVDRLEQRLSEAITAGASKRP